MSNSSSKNYAITTPIYYVNGLPHIGHTYTSIICDTVARYQRQLGNNVFFLTGTDEHGDKIVKAAEKVQKTPQEFTDEISGIFRNTWQGLDISNDDFIRTTDDRHKKVVQTVLKNIYDKGDIYLAEYEGLYCYGCERYLTEKELGENEECPDHKTKPERIKEKNYFFKLQKYIVQWEELLKANPDLIQPKQYYNEVLGTIQELKKLKEDLSISRPKTRLDWGITLPFDEAYVTYVWFDALLNYISSLDYPDGANYSDYWPQMRHVIAKDILKPHGIFWPCMLMAAGIPIFQNLFVHGYWLGVSDEKMSKSLQNARDPIELKERLGGVDLLRYFLVREMHFGSDSKFSNELLEQRINQDLANNIGNLLQRTLSMHIKYFEGAYSADEKDHSIKDFIDKEITIMVKDYHKFFAHFQFHKALELIFQLAQTMNQQIEEYQPWTKAKEGDPQLKSFLQTIIKTTIFLFFYLKPVLPEISEKVIGLIKATSENSFPADLNEVSIPDQTIEKWPILFPRLDLSKGWVE